MKASKEKKEAIKEIFIDNKKLYRVDTLQKVLYALGYSVQLEDLTFALNITGWLKLKAIRENLLELKKQIPKYYPFNCLRNIIKAPLLVKRLQDENEAV